MGLKWWIVRGTDLIFQPRILLLRAPRRWKRSICHGREWGFCLFSSVHVMMDIYSYRQEVLFPAVFKSLMTLSCHQALKEQSILHSSGWSPYPKLSQYYYGQYFCHALTPHQTPFTLLQQAKQAGRFCESATQLRSMNRVLSSSELMFSISCRVHHKKCCLFIGVCVAVMWTGCCKWLLPKWN